MWKSANRGVMLGALLLVIVAIYVIADQIIFSNEKGDINSLVTNYVNDYMTTLKAPDDVIKNKAWTKESGEKEIADYNSLIDKYFTYNHYNSTVSEMNYYINRQTGEDDIKTFYKDETLKDIGFITDTQHSISSVKIKKYGPSGALVTFKLNSKLTVCGAYSITNIDLEPWQDSPVKEDGTIINDTSKSTEHSNSIEVSVQLLRENGSWKISKIATTSFEYSSGTDIGGNE